MHADMVLLAERLCALHTGFQRLFHIARAHGGVVLGVLNLGEHQEVVN